MSENPHKEETAEQRTKPEANVQNERNQFD